MRWHSGPLCQARYRFITALRGDGYGGIERPIFDRVRRRSTNDPRKADDGEAGFVVRFARPLRDFSVRLPLFGTTPFRVHHAHHGHLHGLVASQANERGRFITINRERATDSRLVY